MTSSGPGSAGTTGVRRWPAVPSSHAGPDAGEGIRVARRLDSGMVAVNRGVASDPAAPFVGMKGTGLGREGGFARIHEFLETKYVAVDL